VPVVNRETSLQIEASTNTFACKGTEKERAFRLELPASQSGYISVTLITGTIMMFPASCLDSQRMGM